MWGISIPPHPGGKLQDISCQHSLEVSIKKSCGNGQTFFFGNYTLMKLNDYLLQKLIRGHSCTPRGDLKEFPTQSNSNETPLGSKSFTFFVENKTGTSVLNSRNKNLDLTFGVVSSVMPQAMQISTETPQKILYTPIFFPQYRYLVYMHSKCEKRGEIVHSSLNNQRCLFLDCISPSF